MCVCARARARVCVCVCVCVTISYDYNIFFDSSFMCHDIIIILLKYTRLSYVSFSTVYVLFCSLKKGYPKFACCVLS